MTSKNIDIDNPNEAKQSRGKALVVDDSTFGRSLIASLLTGLGYEVTGAADGDEAMAHTAATRFDLILVDCELPGRNGFDTVRTIQTRQEDKREKSLIIGMSGDTDKGYPEKMLADGADFFLPKPFGRATLSNAIAKAASHR